MVTAEKIIFFCFLLQGVCCRDFSISLSEKIQALSGSCVIIKCRFEINEKHDSELTDTATGLWFKKGINGKDLVFSSSTPVQNSGIIGKITGKLKDKDCTTVFTDIRSTDSGQYYFRIEGEGGLKWTYGKSSVLIDVNDSPERPLVCVSVDEKDLQDDQEVLEGSSVSLRCSAETLCSSPPPTLTWSSTPRIPLSESSRRQELISDLNFTAAHRHHTLTFTCTVTYQIQERNATAHSNFTLRVQYAPKNTSVSVSPSGSVLEGSSVTLTCSSDANPAELNYTWSRVSGGQLKTEVTGDTLTFNRTDRTHRGWYRCMAHNKHGSQNSSVLLDIQYTPKMSSSSSCDATDETMCFCEVDGNPSPKVEWHLSGRPVSNSSHISISEERLNSTGLRSFISLHQSLTNTSTLECVANNTHGSAQQQFYLVFTEKKWPDIYSLLVGLVVGTSLMAILWVTTVLYKRTHKTQSGDKPGLIRTEGADSGDKREEPFYANKVMMPSAEAPTQTLPETLHYSSINFLNSKPESEDIRGVSSLTTEYAILQYRGRDVADSREK